MLVKSFLNNANTSVGIYQASKCAPPFYLRLHLLDHFASKSKGHLQLTNMVQVTTLGNTLGTKLQPD